MRVLLNVKGKKVVAEVSSSVKEFQGELGKAKARAEDMHYAIVNFASVSTIFANMPTIMMPPQRPQEPQGRSQKRSTPAVAFAGLQPRASPDSFFD